MIEGPALVELRFTRDPRDPCWQLRARGAPGACGGLLGWVLEEATLEAVVPADVAQVLSAAFCRSSRVTFLHPLALEKGSGPDWRPIPGGWVRLLKPPALAGILGRRAFPLISTVETEIAELLFRAEPFAWDLRGQAVLLSPRDSPPPHLHYECLNDLWKGKEPSARRLEEAGVEAVVLPGVDGDFAEVVSFRAEARAALEGSLARECAARGLSFRVVPEEEFKNTRWFSAPPRSS